MREPRLVNDLNRPSVGINPDRSIVLTSNFHTRTKQSALEPYRPGGEDLRVN
jgi:hypothetical protein